MCVVDTDGLVQKECKKEMNWGKIVQRMFFLVFYLVSLGHPLDFLKCFGGQDTKYCTEALK